MNELELDELVRRELPPVVMTRDEAGAVYVNGAALRAAIRLGARLHREGVDPDGL